LKDIFRPDIKGANLHILTATISSIAVEENEPSITNPIANPAASPGKIFQFQYSQ
jgi:hypothetical protein